MIYIGKTSLTTIFTKLKAYFAPINSPTLTGTPKAPLPDGSTDSQIATVGYVKTNGGTPLFELDKNGDITPKGE